MPLSTRDFGQLTDELQSIYAEQSQNAIADAIGLTIFNVGETNLLNYEHQILHGLAGIEEVPEGKDLPRLNSEEGDNITYTQRYFGANAPITKKMRKFDLYGKMQDLIRSLVDDAWNKIDQSLADMILNGFLTSYQDVYGKTISAVGPDGLALFSASHTNGTTASTYSNIITNSAATANPALSRDAIVNMIKAGLVYKDPNGLNRPIRYDTLLVPPSLADLAHRIVNNDYLVGSANWDPNMWVKGRIKEVKVWERLESTGQGTARSAYWFMYDSKKVKETLKCLFSERPSLDAPNEVYENKDWEYTLDYFYTTGLGFAPYIAGSQGTA
jgi:hypothetical protein